MTARKVYLWGHSWDTFRPTSALLDKIHFQRTDTFSEIAQKEFILPLMKVVSKWREILDFRCAVWDLSSVLKSRHGCSVMGKCAKPRLLDEERTECPPSQRVA